METLSLPCANRSKENLLPLQAFTNKISEFKKLAQSAREELLRSAQLEKFEDKETVFLHGDYGDKYYVVLSGSVDISIPKYPNKGESEKKTHDEGAPDEEEPPEEIVVAQLGAQCGFGELALITNSPRAATVRAAGVTYLMVFIREEYQNIVGGGLSKALEEKRNFFKSVSIFQQTEKNMQSTHLQNLIYFFQPKTYLKDEVVSDVQSILGQVDKSGEGVCVQASTLGSLEALLEFLKSPDVKIPVSGISIGPVHKKDVMKASIMLERKKEFAVILAFDVDVSREARDMANELGIKIFTADIIYHLFDQFTAYMKKVKEDRKKEVEMDATFPCVLKILPTCIFNKKDPIVLGVEVLAGIAKVGSPLLSLIHI